MLPSRGHYLTLLLILGSLFPLSFSIVPSSHISFRNFFNSIKSSGKSSEKFLKRFVELRTGDNGNNPVFWHHSGVVRNPSNGVAIAGVEGIEYIVPLPERTVFLTNATSLNHPSDGADASTTTKAYSYLTKKLFFYVNPHDPSELMTKFRVQRSAPARPVNPIFGFSQIVSLYRNPVSHGLSCEIEFPGSRKLFSRKVQVVRDRGAEEPGAQSDRTLAVQERYHVGNIISGANPTRKGRLGSWVSFAAGSSPLHGKSQEHLSVWREAPSRRGLMNLLPFVAKGKLSRSGDREGGEKGVRLEYVRYGEAPAWSIPGQACLTEMHATCYTQGYRALPASIRALVEENHPQFVVEVSRLESAKDGRELAALFHSEVDAFQSFVTPWHQVLRCSWGKFLGK